LGFRQAFLSDDWVVDTILMVLCTGVQGNGLCATGMCSPRSAHRRVDRDPAAFGTLRAQ
jgi:hypothetical protein